MLRNYLKIALRNLRKRKGYALINITGLAVGLACCLLIALYVNDELSYDRHHEKADRIYRVTLEYLESGTHWAPIGPPVGLALAESMPGLEQVTRFKHFESTVTFRAGDREFEEEDVLYADSTVFDVFTVPLLRGNPETALREPFTMLISERMAVKYFGSADPVGQPLNFNGEGDLTVVGVFADQPASTHLPFDFLLSMSTFYDLAGDWVNNAKTWAGFYTYALLREDQRLDQVTAQLPGFVDAFYPVDEGVVASETRQLVLQPLRSIHLHSRLEKEYRANSDITYVYLFSVIALFVLGIACINFTNLATARSVERAREVGVRKTVGAGRNGLISQFLIESVLLSTFAMLLALLLAELLLPLFRALSGKALAGTLLVEPMVLLGLLGVALATGFLAGGYPALVLSRFRPSLVLKGHFTSSPRGRALRKGLVIFQFGISIFLIAATAIVYSQMNYFTTKELGFEKERLLKVRLSGSGGEVISEHGSAFKDALLQHTAISHVSLTSDVPGVRYSIEGLQVESRPDQPGQAMRIAWGVDYDYVPTLGVDFVAGRNFSEARATDSTGAFILNEAAVQVLGLEDPLGERLAWGDYVGEIVGVVEDFHFASLHHQIEPLAIPLRPAVANNFALVRMQGTDLRETLAYVRSQWDRLAPGTLFLFSFLDRDFDQLYRAEARLNKVFTIFAGLAIFIACLGLFGLASFTIAQRTKEIGVRKVLGASVTEVVVLLSRDFVRLIGIAFLVAAPLTYVGMSRWLAGFAYRIDLSWWIFLGAGLCALGIALLTVSYQSIRAASANPVDALRYE